MQIIKFGCIETVYASMFKSTAKAFAGCFLCVLSGYNRPSSLVEMLSRGLERDLGTHERVCIFLLGQPTVFIVQLSHSRAKPEQVLYVGTHYFPLGLVWEMAYFLRVFASSRFSPDCRHNQATNPTNL